MHSMVYRLARPGEEGQITAFYNAAFSETTTVEHWRWKYSENPTGEGRVCLAFQDGEIVSMVCGVPLPIWIHGRDAIAMQWTDVGLAAELREGLGGMRVIAELRRQVLDEYISSGYADFGFGLPVPQFAKACDRIFGYKPVCPAPQIVRLLNPAYLLRGRLAHRPRLQQGLRRVAGALRKLAVFPGNLQDKVEIQPLQSFDGGFDLLWQNVRQDLGIAVRRCASHLNWRYPSSRYTILAAHRSQRLEGYAVLRMVKMQGWQVGHIADFLASSKETARSLVNAALNQLARAGADLARCWMMPHAPHYAAFREAGFMIRPSSFDLMALSFKPEVSQEYLREPRNWYLTHGDSDGI